MERDFYVVTDEWGEENVFEDRTIDDVVNEFSKLYHALCSGIFCCKKSYQGCIKRILQR